MSDLLINDSGDLEIGEDGDLVLATGLDAVAQHIRIRLRFFLGEWRFNPAVGIPYFQTIMVKRPNLDVVRSILREVVATTPGVEQVARLELDFDRAARTLRVRLGVIADGGQALDFSEEMILGA
jgi:hypothetical protein